MLRFATSLMLTTSMLGIFCPSAHGQVKYTVKDLGTLGGTFSAAAAINANGDVVGTSSGTSMARAFLYRNGAMMDLGAPFGNLSNAVAINSAGTIVVQSTDLDVHSFLYSNGQFTDLVGLGGNSTIATGINDAGQVVGFSSGHAFLYSNGMIQDLGTFGGTAVQPRAINNVGQIVGTYGVRDPFTSIIESHGFLYSNGNAQDLGVNVFPTAINDAGEFVGTGAVGAFIYRNGQLNRLGDGRGGPAALNNVGGIVGSAFVGSSQNAVLFEDNGLVDLNTLIAPNAGLRLVFATGINDPGQIVGYGLTPSGDTHAFLLTPVPEPAGLAILLLGVATLCRRRRTA